jgi:hypothetical protein
LVTHCAGNGRLFRGWGTNFSRHKYGVKSTQFQSTRLKTAEKSTRGG